MTFTREDILKIQNALLQLGRKDSEFEDANTPLNSDDYIAILQDGINKKVSINNLLSTLGLLKKDDFINVSDRYDEYYILLSEAITIIANNKRKKGLVITFQDIKGNWKIYQFTDEISNFIKTEHWKDLFDFKYSIVNSIIPDEEDLTLTYPNNSNNSFIKFKDKDYNPNIFNGKGYKILRKNIVDGKNVLTQDMFTQSNTIYEIRYDFILIEDITIPANCMLKFNGGSISGTQTLTGNNTGIEAGLVNIFNTDVTLVGTWNVAEAYPEWFGAKGDGETDDTAAINASLKYFVTTKLRDVSYYINSVYTDSVYTEPVTLPDKTVCEDVCIFVPTYHSLIGQRPYNGRKNTLVLGTIKPKAIVCCSDGAHLSHFKIYGNGREPENETGVIGVLFRANDYSGWSYGTVLEEVVASNVWLGFEGQVYSYNFIRCGAKDCVYGFYIHGKTNAGPETYDASVSSLGTTIRMIGCNANGCKIYGYRLHGENYSIILNCSIDHCTYAPDITYTADKIDDTSIGWAYVITLCLSLTMLDCGAEDILRYIQVRHSNNVIIQNSHILMGGKRESQWDLLDMDDTFVFYKAIWVVNSNSITFDGIYIRFKNPPSAFDIATYIPSTGGIVAPRYILINPYASGASSYLSNCNCATFRNIDCLCGSTRPVTIKAILNLASEKDQVINLNNALISDLHSGSTADRPAVLDVRSGYSYFDKDINKMIWSTKNGYKYIEADGAKAGVKRSGTNLERPAGGDIYIGFMYLDVSLGKPIYASAISGNTVTWVDATGATV